MEKIKFIAAQNEIQRIYSDFGLIVPVGDLDEGHAPSIKPLPSSSTTDSVTASFNIISNADITSLSYKVNDGAAVSVTPQKGVVTITLNDLEYNSGPYTIEITAVNETGSTSAKSTTDLQLYTDWAEPESVLAGNKFIAEGEELVGNIPTKTSEDVTIAEDDSTVTIPAGYFASETQVKIYDTDYFCVEALYDELNQRYQADIVVKNYGTNIDTKPTLYYSTDKIHWTLYPNDESTISVVGEGSKLYMYGDNAIRFTSSAANQTKFTITGACSISGNLLSLITKNYSVISKLPDYCFYQLFKDSTGIVDASGLILPLTLSKSCFSNMFNGCTSLTAAPTLSVTTLAEACYSSMFQNCTSLATAPALPATSLVLNCYNGMFQGCTSLTTAPALPATTLANNCYLNMFEECTSLTVAPALPATTLAKSCYEYMFSESGVINSPSLPATTLAERCYYGMFWGTPSLTTAPALPATTLAPSCYYGMFKGTSITSIPELNATSLSNSCYYGMFEECTGLTEATIQGEITTIGTTSLSSMFKNCSSLSKVTIYSTTWATNKATGWLTGVAATGDFYNLGGATIPTGTNGIPSGWTEHTEI